jgi:hypothetical protein
VRPKWRLAQKGSVITLCFLMHNDAKFTKKGKITINRFIAQEKLRRNIDFICGHS